MPRRLILLRHAKSSWDDALLRDFDRPLNKRGLRDAPRMGRLLHDKSIRPGRIISSDAVRARATAELVSTAMTGKAEDIELDHSLYLAAPDTLLDVLAAVPAAIDTVMLVAHNPGMTMLANRLSEARIDNLPTCGVFIVNSDEDDWSRVRERPARFEAFYCPRNDLG